MAAALLAGATGLVGRQIVAAWPAAQAGLAQRPPLLHLLVRRPLAQAPPGCSVQVVDFSALPALPQAASAYCCLGTTLAQAGSQAAFKAVDLDAVLAFAQAARTAGVRRFAVVSALGADPAASNFYNRVKGQMEAALEALGFSRLVIARPSLLAGDRAALSQAARPAERLALALTAPLGRLLPAAWRPIEAATVARALLAAMADTAPDGLQVLSSARLQEMGAAQRSR